MGPFTIIKTFNDVKFDKEMKPLVICDIDHTFMRCLHDLEHFRQILNADYEEVNRIFKSVFTPPDDSEAFDLMNTSYNLGFIKQTDPEGFNQMLQTIEKLGGKFVFLTARSIAYHNKTTEELKKVGFLYPENYDIHYTNNEMTKGEYIKKTNLINGFDHISFIDDYPSFLASVYEFFPNINCYMFRYD